MRRPPVLTDGPARIAYSTKLSWNLKTRLVASRSATVCSSFRLSSFRTLARDVQESYLVDPASSYMLVSKIKAMHV